MKRRPWSFLPCSPASSLRRRRGASTSVSAYVVAVGGEYEVDALFSVNDKVPVPAAPGRTGWSGSRTGSAHPNGNGTSTAVHEPRARRHGSRRSRRGGPRTAPRRRLEVDPRRDGDPIAGSARTTRSTRRTRSSAPRATRRTRRRRSPLLLGLLAGRSGLRPLDLLRERGDGPRSATFDGQGGLAIAIFDNEVARCPARPVRVGEHPRSARHRQPHRDHGHGGRPVARPDDNSQVYMYVGRRTARAPSRAKQRPRQRNAVRLRSTNRTATASTSSAVHARRRGVAIPSAGGMTDARSRPRAMPPARSASPARGRRLQRPKTRVLLRHDRVTPAGAPTTNARSPVLAALNKRDPTRRDADPVVYNADKIIAAGGDIAISPDNIDASSEYLMINEDGTGASRPVDDGEGSRRLDLALRPEADKVASMRPGTRVAELDPPGRDGSPPRAVPGRVGDERDHRRPVRFGLTPGSRTSRRTRPTTAPGGRPVTVEDGQLFLLRPTT